ncbi:DUF3833 family protein [Pontibacterium sp. N1Y112]|uniref:DUF3833 family protein n=2 Tax=Pontibacterium sinense TaxID=2781979 RepID=A0A8J7F8I3_9GAMM|nr:DUF3833 family protein [Pontibacterium sinense]
MINSTYANEAEEFDLFSYFQGETRAWGLFEDRFGVVRRQFVVQIVGEIKAGELTLTEDFAYAGGITEQRIWRIRRTGDCDFRGLSEDIFDQAVGHRDGNTLYWRYTMKIHIGGQWWRVKFDDRMYMLPEQTLVNRARVSKLGITLGTVSLFFKKTNS